MTVRLAGAELVDSREILPGQWIQAFHAPAVANGARAGQFVHLRTGEPATTLLPRPLAVNTVDPTSANVTVHFRVGSRATDWLTRLRPGDAADLSGPYGRSYEVDSRSRHVLLIAHGIGIARVRMLVDESIRDGRQVTLLFGAERAGDVYPSTLLPDEVEYLVATADGSMGHRGSVVDLVPSYEAWADQAFAAGPRPMLAALARLAATRRSRLGVASLGRKRGGGRPEPPGSAATRRRAFLQVALEHDLGCATATCLGCVVPAADGTPRRVCRAGPVFAADELDWEIVA